ncbi:sigma-54-dependent Fis family transcriptional regulator [Methylomonas rapida]|uniref:Sigma 54-interacting transcriptional regulator n=1 Tax=Methylomonas rapida TaxID=2963939 RepID=A0ABY7GFG8_9GAMM|nr:sigma 54-interacting transcriptional regulator [Methylomonas rapida]WAR43201.1 sigma 54-interacting transcriptional regulator [Methylomonas rapida]
MEIQDKNIALVELEQSLKIQSLLGELSNTFVRVPNEQIDQAVQNSLCRIAEQLDLDHIALGLITPDSQDFYSKYCYAKSCSKPWQADSLMAEGPYLTRTLLAGKPFIMHDVDKLPHEGAVDRENFLRYNIRADLVFPFVVGGHLCGGIGFASSRPRHWTNETVRGLGLIADVFANVLERKRTVQTIQGREEQMRLAAEAAGIGLWVWNIPKDKIWATDRAREIYGVPLQEELSFQRFLDCLHPDDKQSVNEVVQRILQGENQLRHEYRVLHADGSEHWVCATGRCQRSASGLPELLMGATLNITEVRRNKIELERANADLKLALEQIGSLKDQLQHENIYLRHEISGRYAAELNSSNSPAMRRIQEQIEQVGPTLATVLIIGETGTGKERLATALHEASPRKDRPMIRVNCAAIPAALIESELFGREKGAYTGALSRQVGRFELADRSTLFLDEVGELPLEAQAKLLRALQEKEIERLGNPKPIKIDVRVIAATNRNLANEVAAGRFREDLYYRLNVFPIELPPLRERREDIPKLVEAFVNEFALSMDKNVDGVAKASMESLRCYAWPGNIRELRNIVERAVILAKGPILKIALPNGTIQTTTPAKPAMGRLEDVERDYILRVLEATGWRVRGQGGAAEILGLKPSTLESRMIKLNIHRPSV